MPPRVKYSKEEVLNAAYEIVRTRGSNALNARGIAGALGCSTQPLFRAFQSMEQIRDAVTCRALEAYNRRIAESAKLDARKYMSAGLAYIRFAKEEPELFKLLFMRDRTVNKIEDLPDDPNMPYILDLVMRSTNLSYEEAVAFHRHLWVFVHGLASMIATQFVPYDDALIKDMMSEEFDAVTMLYRARAERAASLDQPRG